MKNIVELAKWVNEKDELVEFAGEFLMYLDLIFNDSRAHTRHELVLEATDMIFDAYGQRWDEVQYEELLEYMKGSAELQKDTYLEISTSEPWYA